MSVLTENIVLSRTRAQDLNSVRKLNCWGSELSDISIVRRMPYVEVLSLSVNSISSLLDFSYCKTLQELYIRKNFIDDLNEVIYLKDLPRLKSLWLEDNPCAECDHYRMTVLRTLPNLQKLDNITVLPQEVEQAKSKGRILIKPCDAAKKVESAGEDLSSSPPKAAHIIPPQVKTENENLNGHKYNNEFAEQISPNQNSTSEREVVPSEISVPKQARAAAVVYPKIEPIHEPKEPVYVEPQLPPRQQPVPRTQEISSVRHSSSFSSVEHHEQHSVSTPTSAGHHNHAFYAKVQTLVDHTVRRPRKPSDLRSEARSNKSATASPPPLTINDDMSESCHPGDMDSHYYSGSAARDFSELETRSCSMDSESSYYAEQRAAVGSNVGTNSRSDKNSPTRILPKGGRNRNSNILSAVLCLIKELDFASLEVVETAIHCQMEDLDG